VAGLNGIISFISVSGRNLSSLHPGNSGCNYLNNIKGQIYLRKVKVITSFKGKICKYKLNGHDRKSYR
jgi:hypothetical protein